MQSAIMYSIWRFLPCIPFGLEIRNYEFPTEVRTCNYERETRIFQPQVSEV